MGKISGLKMIETARFVVVVASTALVSVGILTILADIVDKKPPSLDNA